MISNDYSIFLEQTSLHLIVKSFASHDIYIVLDRPSFIGHPPSMWQTQKMHNFCPRVLHGNVPSRLKAELRVVRVVRDHSRSLTRK